MNRRIAVLGCGWSSYFLKDFINGMMRAVEGKNIDIYIFNTYNYVEYSGFPNSTGFSIFNLINYEEFDGIVITMTNDAAPLHFPVPGNPAAAALRTERWTRNSTDSGNVLREAWGCGCIPPGAAPKSPPGFRRFPFRT